MLGYFIPDTILELIKFSILSFMIGYIIEYIIYKQMIFGESLNPYFEKYGSGFWGSFALLFCIFLSYGIIRLKMIFFN